MAIRFSNINIGKAELENVIDAMRRDWISGSGDYIDRFEAALTQATGAKYAIATANGTLALVLALQALGVGRGDHVIVPNLTFAAPAAAVRMVGAWPILCDVDPATWTIDPQKVRHLIRHDTTAIIAVDTLGHPADYDALRDVAAGLPIIQDAAEAHGAFYKGAPVGNQGDVAIMSFHANKTITTGEGGCLLTSDQALADRARLIANHGMSPDRRYWHEVVGSNYRMTNVTAAIGVAQMARWDELVEGRRQVAALYDEWIDNRFIRRPTAAWATPSTWMFALDAGELQSAVYEALKLYGVDARRIWRPLSEMPPYETARDFSESVKIADSVIMLPTWAGMRRGYIEVIAGIVNLVKGTVR